TGPDRAVSAQFLSAARRHVRAWVRRTPQASPPSAYATSLHAHARHLDEFWSRAPHLVEGSRRRAQSGFDQIPPRRAKPLSLVRPGGDQAPRSASHEGLARLAPVGKRMRECRKE